jgi:DNA-binding NtrC family response regulator
VNAPGGPMQETHGLTNSEKNILVVDDDPTILKLISGLLKHQFNLLLAKDGNDAFQQANKFGNEIHLLLTDFQMAGMNGIELATQVTIQRPQLKIVIMSGTPPPMLAFNEGWHFIAKPFIPSELRKMVTDLIYPTL